MYNLHPQMLKGHIGVKLSASVNEEVVKRWPQMQKLENWEPYVSFQRHDSCQGKGLAVV